MSHALSAALAGLAIVAATPVSAQPAMEAAAAKVLQQGYVAAWDKADPSAIAGFFAADGDFINPTGFHAQGRAAIAAFYAQAFAAGYAGSQGGFALKRTRTVAPGVIVVDGDWSIRGAHAPDGGARPDEQGAATAVLVQTGEGWHVAALREQEAPPK